jgi:glycosyltransferase involved in cell wall biosynthesis
VKAKAKKLLIITYYWPPSGGSGVQRWMYFAKNLKALGWEPFIITVDEKQAAYPVLDSSLNKEVKNLTTIRTQTREPLRWYARLNSSSDRGGIPQGAIQRKDLFGKLAAFIRGNFFIPDARKGWRKFAWEAAQNLVQKEGIDLVVTTGPPHSAHWVGSQLKSKFGLRWIIDFRDPWVTLFYNAQLYRTSWAVKKDQREEAQIVNYADCVLTTVAGNFHNYLKNLAPNQTFYALPNGYDAALMAKTPEKKHPYFHIVYTGLLTENQAYKTLIAALKKLPANNEIVVSLAGQIPENIINEFKENLPESKVKDHGYLAHEKAVQLMKSADLLVNFIFRGAEQQMISGKLLEYIATEKPILCLGNPDSEVGPFLMQGTAGVLLSPDAEKEILEFIGKARREKGQLRNKFPQIEDWSREAISARLARLL